MNHNTSTAHPGIESPQLNGIEQRIVDDLWKAHNKSAYGYVRTVDAEAIVRTAFTEATQEQVRDGWQDISAAPVDAKELGRCMADMYKPPCSRLRIGHGIDHPFAFWLDLVDGQWQATKFMQITYPYDETPTKD